jgi:hypothetical protein
MTEVAYKINAALRRAEEVGGWADYAVYVLGMADTGSEELDEALERLYEANESVHRIANKLALRYDLDLFGGT